MDCLQKNLEIFEAVPRRGKGRKWVAFGVVVKDGREWITAANNVGMWYRGSRGKRKHSIAPGVGRFWILRTFSLLPVSCRPAWEADFGVYEIVIRFRCHLQREPAYINDTNQSTVHLLCQDITQTCLSFDVVGALERVGHATFGGRK